jgi:hypothetical protein
LCERGCPCEISGDIRHALDYAALAAKLAGMGLTVVPGDAKEFARAADEQRRQVHEMARIIGLKAPSGEVGR